MFHIHIDEKRMYEQLNNKDARGLESLISLYQPYVKKIVNNITGPTLTKEDKEEVIADVFVSFWEHIDTYQFEKRESAKMYLAVIAKNLALNRCRDMRKHEHCELDEGYEVFSGDENMDRVVLRKETQKALLDALGQLPGAERKCFLLYYYYDQTIAEIAEAVHMKENTVKSRLHRGRKKLEAILSERGMSYESLHI